MHAKLARRILRFRIGARRLGMASAGCHPARWLWGLIPIAMLSWIAVHTRADQIEGDLELRSRRALDAAGYSWASVAFSGRDGLLVGTPGKSGEALQAKLLLDRLWGVRSVQERTAPFRITTARKSRSRRAPKKSQIALQDIPPVPERAPAHMAPPETSGTALPARNAPWHAAAPEAQRVIVPETPRAAAADVLPTSPTTAATEKPAAPETLSAVATSPPAAIEPSPVAEPVPETKTHESKAHEEKAPKTKPAETKTTQPQSVETRPTETKPAETKLAETKPIEKRAAEAKATKPTDGKANEAAKTPAPIDSGSAGPSSMPQAKVPQATTPVGGTTGPNGPTATSHPKEKLATFPATTAAPSVAKGTVSPPASATPGCDTAVRDIAAVGPLRFRRNAAGLDRSKRNILNKLAGLAAACPDLKLQISGHADARGNTKRNQSLSERRARVVVGYLITKGIDAGRLKAVGYGDTRPLASNDDAHNRAKNRRIEFEVTGLQSTGLSGE